MSRLPGPVDDEPDGSSIEGLVFLVERQRDLIVAIATGTSIDAANDSQYKRRRRKLKPAIANLGLDDPFPWPDLYQWWGYCAAPRFTTYRERRDYVASVTEPLLDRLDQLKAGAITDWTTEEQPTWRDLGMRLEGLKAEYNRSSTLDDFQDVGRRAREIVIDAANLAFDETMVPPGEEVPKGSDPKNRLDYYLQVRVEGPTRSELRKLLRAAWDVVNKVTHSGSATRVDAFAAAQAAVLLVRTVGEIEAEVQDSIPGQDVSPSKRADHQGFGSE